MQLDSSTGDVALVILAVILSLAGIVVSLSCSWMTSKKRRVANNAGPHGDNIMLQIPGKAGSPNLKAPSSKRYSTPSPLVILPISSLAHTLVAPTIIITPPSPLAILADSTSIRSDSSIGSAADLLIEDEVVNGNENDINDKENVDFCGDSLDEENHKRERRRFIEVKNKRQYGEQVLYRVHQCDASTKSGRKELQKGAGTAQSTDPQVFKLPRSGSSSSNSDNRSSPSSQTFTINVVTKTCGLGGSHFEGQGGIQECSRVGEVKDTSIDVESIHHVPPSRPRLKSMEPGTKRSDFHFYRANQISEVQVGNS